MRDSCIFYRSFFEAIKELPKENQADVYNAIFEHSLNFNEINLSGINKTIMTLIKPQLDANIKRFENGKKPKQKQNESKTEANNNVNVNNNKNLNDNDVLLEKETKEDFNDIEILHLNNQEEKRKKVAPKKEINMPYEFIEIWDLWIEYRKAKKIKNYANDKFEQMAVDKLLKFSNNNPQIAKQIIEESITNSWTGFFLKNKIVEPIVAGRQTLSTIQSNSDWSMIENPYEKK